MKRRKEKSMQSKELEKGKVEDIVESEVKEPEAKEEAKPEPETKKIVKGVKGIPKFKNWAESEKYRMKHPE